MESAPEVDRSKLKKILVVDDDPIILKTASVKLEAEGYAVMTASDGAEAIRCVHDDPPDLILLDINFPPDIANGGVPWDGFSLLGWLRNLEGSSQVPVLFITVDSAPYRARSGEMGALGILDKPLNYQQLVPRLRGILEDHPRPRVEGQI